MQFFKITIISAFIPLSAFAAFAESLVQPAPDTPRWQIILGGGVASEVRQQSR